MMRDGSGIEQEGKISFAVEIFDQESKYIYCCGFSTFTTAIKTAILFFFLTFQSAMSWVHTAGSLSRHAYFTVHFWTVFSFFLVVAWHLPHVALICHETGFPAVGREIQHWWDVALRSTEQIVLLFVFFHCILFCFKYCRAHKILTIPSNILVFFVLFFLPRKVNRRFPSYQIQSSQIYTQVFLIVTLQMDKMS